MALGIEILELKATAMANEAKEDKKALIVKCPSASHPMRKDEDTGVWVNIHTGLAPVFMLESIPERGWNRGEVHGMLAGNAKQVIDKGLGMALPGAGSVKENPDADEEAKKPAPKGKAEKPAATA